MIIAIDIGNTNIHIGVFDQGILLCSGRISTDTRRMPDEYGLTVTNMLEHKKVDLKDIEGACLCSVVPPLTNVMEQMCLDYFGVTPIVVNPGTKTGVRILYDNPWDVGSDRVVDALATLHLYGGPAIIVDFGTATVFDAVSQNGDYLGGAIAPGISIAAESLHKATSQLRRVGINRPKSAIGRNSVASLQSGLFLGYLSLVEGMVKRFKQELGEESKVIATGGFAELISKETSSIDIANADLTLLGLQMVYDMNKPNAAF